MSARFGENKGLTWLENACPRFRRSMGAESGALIVAASSGGSSKKTTWGLPRALHFLARAFRETWTIGRELSGRLSLRPSSHIGAGELEK